MDCGVPNKLRPFAGVVLSGIMSALAAVAQDRPGSVVKAVVKPVVQVVAEAQGPKSDPTSRAGLKAAIDAGHVWLKKHQEKDGHFSASMFLVHDPRGKACDGPGKPDQDVFVTALVSKAWRGMGWRPDAGRTHDYQCRAMEWLETQVQEDGALGLPGSRTLVRDTAIASSSLHRSERLMAGLGSEFDSGLAAKWLLAQRLPSGFWQAGAKAQGERGADWLTTFMAARFLAEVDASSIDWASLKGFVELQSDVMPGAAYGGGAHLAAWYIRHVGKRTEYCKKSLLELPAKHARADKVDYYSWFGTTQAMQFEHVDDWQAWWHALTTTAVSMQRTDGSFAGSWDPLDVRGRDGGRIYATATMLLALEVIWRKQYRDR
ncbi:MAG: hypothetical protein ACI90M_001995 [Candidatus Azotimanducaceae bacterium]|jgi:hypothetical protein